MRAALIAAAVALLGVAAPSNAADPRSVEAYIPFAEDFAIDPNRANSAVLFVVYMEGAKLGDYCQATIVPVVDESFDNSYTVPLVCRVYENGKLEVFAVLANNQCDTSLTAGTDPIVTTGDVAVRVCFQTPGQAAAEYKIAAGARLYLKTTSPNPTAARARHAGE